MMTDNTNAGDGAVVETHPWQPFIPPKAKVLIMGTFPPGRHRWSMDFYYPNRTNDFWFMMGLIFKGDKDAFYNREKRLFDLERIKGLLTEKGIALHDTCRKIRRLKGNASDKYLEVVEPVPLFRLLSLMPECRTISTTGEKAATVIADLTGTPVPKMGTEVIYNGGSTGKELHIWRMPSTSRAYPLSLEKKADYYRQLFADAGILPSLTETAGNHI